MNTTAKISKRKYQKLKLLRNIVLIIFLIATVIFIINITKKAFRDFDKSIYPLIYILVVHVVIAVNEHKKKA